MCECRSYFRVCECMISLCVEFSICFMWGSHVLFYGEIPINHILLDILLDVAYPLLSPFGNFTRGDPGCSRDIAGMLQVYCRIIAGILQECGYIFLMSLKVL